MQAIAFIAELGARGVNLYVAVGAIDAIRGGGSPSGLFVCYGRDAQRSLWRYHAALPEEELADLVERRIVTKVVPAADVSEAARKRLEGTHGG